MLADALAIEREELAKRRLEDGPLMWVCVTNIAGMLGDIGAHAEAEALWREVHTHHASAFGEAELADAERAKRARGVDLGAEHAEAGGH